MARRWQKGGERAVADRIELMGLKAFGHHGVYDFEKSDGQNFEVDIVVWTDFSTSVTTDDLADTISYVDLADIAVAVVEQEHFDLIETLAATIADRIIELGGVHAAEVTVHKPQAPIPHRFDDVRVVARRNLKHQRGK